MILPQNPRTFFVCIIQKDTIKKPVISIMETAAVNPFVRDHEKATTIAIAPNACIRKSGDSYI